MLQLGLFILKLPEVPRDPQHPSISGTQEQQSHRGGAVTYFSRVCGFMAERRLRAHSACCLTRAVVSSLLTMSNCFVATL